MPRQLRLPFMNPTDQFELENIARWARRRAGFRPTDMPFGVNLISALCGSDAYAVDARLPSRGMLFRRGDFRRIMVRPKALDENFVATHELAHYLLRYVGFPSRSRREERFANFLAAALLVTPEALLSNYRKLGEDLLRLSVVFDTSQSLIHRRLAEVLGDVRGIIRGDGLGSIDIYNAGAITTRQLLVLRIGAQTNSWPQREFRGFPMKGSDYDAGRTAFRSVA